MAWLFAVVALFAAPVLAQQDIGIARLAQAIEAQQGLNGDLRLAVPRIEQETEQEAQRLEQDERQLGEDNVTMAVLRQARHDADTRRTRLAAAQGRAVSFAAEVAKLDQQIGAVKQQAPPPEASLEGYAAAVKLRLLGELRALTQETVDLYRQAAIHIGQRLDTLNERLALLQSRARLGGVDEAAALESDPRAQALRELVIRTGRDRVRLANEAGALEARSNADMLRKQELELQADEAFLRSSLRAADIELLGIEKQLAFLRAAAAADTRALPERLAAEGLAALDELRLRLGQRSEVIAEVRLSLADQRSLLPQPNPATAVAIGTMRNRTRRPRRQRGWAGRGCPQARRGNGTRDDRFPAAWDCCRGRGPAGPE